MGRPSLTLPEHRRPAYAKNSITYRANITNPSPRPRGNRRDYGLDNFSYNPVHLAEFEIPDGLTDSLPKELRNAATDWVYAGAALRTAIDRIEKLDDNPVKRANPPTSRSHSFAGSSTEVMDTDTKVENLTTNAPVASNLPIVAPIAKYNRCPVVNPYTQLPTSMLGMESPPFTPVDSKGPGTPADSHAASNATEPDLSRLIAQLYPLVQQNVPTPSFAHELGISHDKTWEHYVKAYNAEIYDLKHNAITRVTGGAHNICKLILELELDKGPKPELRSALRQFKAWWYEKQYAKVSQYQSKVRSLHEKRM